MLSNNLGVCMKRSEIVDEITHILDMEAEDLCYPFLAELILATLENKGMYMTKVESLCDDVDLRVITYWDEENE